MKLTERQIETIQDELKAVDVETLYHDMLDEVYGDVDICGYTRRAADVFKEIDPIAYQCGLTDYLDSLLGERLVEVQDEYFDLHEVEQLLKYLKESAS